MPKRQADKKQERIQQRDKIKQRQNPSQPQNQPSAPAEKKRIHHRQRNAVIIAALGITLLAACFLGLNWNAAPQQQQQQQPTPTNTTSSTPKAAILDGLYDKSPNQTLLTDMAQYLVNAGYAVDVYKGADVTINMLRDIGGYKILILRLHSAIHTDDFLYVFSGETYTETKYTDEQLAGAVRKAYTFNDNETPYFALNSVFIGQRAPNGLNGTTLMLMGCNGTANNYVVQRFFQEGVQAYISWDGYVDLPHSDEATLQLIKALCIEKLNPAAAVEKVRREVGPDPAYQSQLICNLP